MLQRKFKALSGNKFLFKRRGQVAILFALMMPIFLLMIGVALDLGWYYLNVSRLQNAADAAAVAGAKAIVQSENFSSYKNVSLVNKYPGKISNEYRASDIYELTAIENGNSVAKDYVAKNLLSEKDTMINSWTKTEVGTDEGLYEKDNNLYYVVKLKEEIRHFFLPGWFDDMTAPVTSVVLLTKQEVAAATDPVPPQAEDIPNENPARDPGRGAEQHLAEGVNLLFYMYKVEDASVIRNWEWQSHATEDTYRLITGGTKDKNTGTIIGGAKKYNGSWNEFQDKTRDAKGNQKVVHYSGNNDDHYRTETVLVQPNSSDATTNNQVDTNSLNLDFHPDVEYRFTEDWDIGHIAPTGMKQTYRSSYNGGYNLRIHSTFNFGEPYPVREVNKYDTKNNPQDVLYIRIESEPIWAMSGTNEHGDSWYIKEQTFFSTVRQIILNINQSNYNVTDDNGNVTKKYRPLMFFYDGPEQINPENVDEKGYHRIRPSKPVILNFYADARVILFAPNSPVVINGNGHQMHGFVIAKEYVCLATAEDFRKIGDRFYGEDGTEYFKIQNQAKDAGGNIVGTCDVFIDSTGNVQTKPLPLKSGYTRNPIYDRNLERPLRTDIIQYRSYEKVYKMHTAFNLDTGDEKRGTTYYDSFNLESLTRNVYTYLDNYKSGDEDHPNAVDMFFTTLRSSWID